MTDFCIHGRGEYIYVGISGVIDLVAKLSNRRRNLLSYLIAYRYIFPTSTVYYYFITFSMIMPCQWQEPYSCVENPLHMQCFT